MRRVVITGMGSVSPFGNTVSALCDGVEQGASAVRRFDEWKQYQGLQSLVGAQAALCNEKDIPRKNRRSMGRLSIFAAQAAEQALKDSGLTSDIVESGRCGCVIGSTMGGVEAMNDTFELMLPNKDLSQLSSMKFFQTVSHTAAMNVSQYLGINGYVMATSSACASSLQAIGAGFELIQMGKQDMFFCGGAEELHPIVTGVFDILYATSTKYNDDPTSTPRPFDAKRDGIVCGEGSGVLVLEEYEHAMKRNAKVYGEVVGYNTCGSGAHVSQSNAGAMVMCMKNALSDASISASDVDYINAHATGTVHGDESEVAAISEVFGAKVPVSGFKGHIGHTLGASGALELIVALAMTNKKVIWPTRNLETVSEECVGVDHVQAARKKEVTYFLKNCFAFGGINASLVCKAVEQQ